MGTWHSALLSARPSHRIWTRLRGVGHFSTIVLNRLREVSRIPHGVCSLPTISLGAALLSYPNKGRSDRLETTRAELLQHVGKRKIVAGLNSWIILIISFLDQLLNE